MKEKRAFHRRMDLNAFFVTGNVCKIMLIIMTYGESKIWNPKTFTLKSSSIFMAPSSMMKVFDIWRLNTPADNLCKVGSNKGWSSFNILSI